MPPELPVHIQLPPLVAHRLDLSRWEKAATRRLEQLLADYRLEAALDLRVTPDSATEALTLTIAGQACFYPETWLAEAATLALGRPLAGWAAPDWRDWASDVLAIAFLWLCEAAGRNQPALFFTPSVAEAWLAQTPAASLAGLTDWRIAAQQTLAWQAPLPDDSTLRQTALDTDAQTLFPWGTTEKWLNQTATTPLTIEINPAYLEGLTSHASPQEREQFTLLRDGIMYELGLRLPSARWQPDPTLPPAVFRFHYQAWRSLPQVGLLPNQVLVNAEIAHLGWLASSARPAVNPASQLPASIVEAAYAPFLQAAGYTTWGPLGYLILCLTRHLREQAGILLSLNQVDNSCQRLRDTHPALVEAALSRAPLPLLASALRQLLAGGGSIRNLRLCLQAVVDFATLILPTPDAIVLDDCLALPYRPTADALLDPPLLAASMRAALREAISYKLSGGDLSLVVYLFDSELERTLANTSGLPLYAHLAALSPALRRAVVEAVRATLADVVFPYTGLALLTTADLQPVVQALLKPVWPSLPVVGYPDLHPNTRLDVQAYIGLDSERFT